MTPRTIRAAFDVQVCVALAAGKGDLARALRVACAAVLERCGRVAEAPYPGCRDPELCAVAGYCGRDPNCGD